MIRFKIRLQTMDDVNEFSLNVIKLFDEVADEYGNLIIEYQDEEQ